MLKDISHQKRNQMFGCANADHCKILKAERFTQVDESKLAYLRKYHDEAGVKDVLDKFWTIRHRLKAPQNDISWWMKKPFTELKSFVQSYQPAPNKRQRRDAEYRREAINYDAKMLGQDKGYEIWYVPTYDAMRALGRFYKGRSAKWCVASDDPDFWFDMHDNDEFVLLIRETPQNDEFDKIAVQMENQGRRYDDEHIVPWDLENNDWTFTDDDLIYHAWELFKRNGETRDQYF